MGNKKQYNEDDFAAALKGSGGLLTIVARRMGCTWQTAQRYVQNSPRLMELYVDEREAILDVCEKTVIDAVQAGDVQTAKWYLALLGGNRGFGNRVEITFGGRTAAQLSNDELLNNLRDLSTAETDDYDNDVIDVDSIDIEDENQDG